MPQKICIGREGFFMKTFAGWAGLFALLCNTGSALAYRNYTCSIFGADHPIKFSSNNETVYASTVSFPSRYWQDGIRDTVDKFNSNPSNFRYSLAMKPGRVGRGNGQNEIWGDTGSILAGAPARAYLSWTCYWFFGDHVHMDEADVIYNYGSPWTADTVKSSLIGYTGSLRAIQTTGAHELGHGLGLLHENRWYNIMGSDFKHIHVNGSTATAYTGEDAANAMIFLYGARSPAWEDVGVVHWKYLGPSGQYSNHTKTEIYDTSGAVLPTYTVNGETGYQVIPGQTVRAEFTYENNGANTHTGIQTGYYISTNDLITTLDRKIGSASFDLSRDVVFTSTVDLVIPSDLTPDTNYWLGVIIDDNNIIPEAVESNNATYVPIRVIGRAFCLNGCDTRFNLCLRTTVNELACAEQQQNCQRMCQLAP
jgi:hypothetical protein